MDHNFAQLVPLDNPFVESLRNRVLRLLKRSEDASLTLVKQEGWVAVPVESASHLDPNDQTRLLRAINDRGDERLYAVVVEPLQEFPGAFAVPPTSEGLQDFDQSLAHFNVVLIPNLLTWIVVFTTYDYFIATGPPDFIQALVGCAPESAFARFREFVEGSGATERVRRALVGIHDALKDEYENARAGDDVKLTSKSD